MWNIWKMAVESYLIFYMFHHLDSRIFIWCTRLWVFVYVRIYVPLRKLGVDHISHYSIKVIICTLSCLNVEWHIGSRTPLLQYEWYTRAWRIAVWALRQSGFENIGQNICSTVIEISRSVARSALSFIFCHKFIRNEYDKSKKFVLGSVQAFFVHFFCLSKFMFISNRVTSPIKRC